MKEKCTAVVLAGGSGRRMQSDVAKQYLLLRDKPMIWYSLQAFEKSDIIDECILVVGKGEIPYCQQEIVEKYGFSKVRAVVEGGAERYLSVWAALSVIKERDTAVPDMDGYIFIHDGARPFVNEKIIADTYAAVAEHGACVAAMPVKDTIKICDRQGFALQTPSRGTLWAVQTPQVFSAELIIEAYSRLIDRYGTVSQGTVMEDGLEITDDAMVVESFIGQKVKMVPAGYGNLKITTPEDMKIAQSLL